jgi:hypothetical protein
MNQTITPNDFSNYLFWDTDKSQLDLDKQKRYVIERVLSHGMLSDWHLIKKLYDIETMRKEVLQMRYLDRYALSFCVAYFDEPKTNFRCYTWEQSNPSHWSY